MRRGLLVIALCLLLGVAIGLTIFYWAAVAHWVLHVTGADDEGGTWYGAWSGFLGANWTILGVAGVWYWHHTCHNRTCLRLGTHQTPAGYTLCKRCIAKPATALTLHDIHPDHR